jgi:hypothetical protein
MKLLSSRLENVFGLVVWENLIVQLERKLLEDERVLVMMVEQEFLVLSANQRTIHQEVLASDTNILVRLGGIGLFLIQRNTNHCNFV